MLSNANPFWPQARLHNQRRRRSVTAFEFPYLISLLPLNLWRFGKDMGQVFGNRSSHLLGFVSVIGFGNLYVNCRHLHFFAKATPSLPLFSLLCFV